ncbi:phosphoadenosine phosphosulfate reductase family protein [Sphingobacterium sp. N143]|uniref:phosphoadenosine phosphosulfate reductase family protein n=1 Tax=Sphingobacterium sp. N143 TaxID=2746727 RepID=UPI00257857BD|nr:phosphoadenosine phosphosulfate reductase family protein [Sphingobacterium sp. N143]MDM1296532.1 phosphoadenosine phosphosulfate reductase family protein [Sphingobacterium sp. N143]
MADNKKVRHVLGISGGKDSAALAIYMKNNYPELDIEYYTADTGKELEETYQLIRNLEAYLGKKIIKLKAFDDSVETPFDHKMKTLGGFLPSTKNRWCTKTLKLDVFEEFVGNDQVISYVGIRGDEDREGYISDKSTIQSIYPFRQNIWSVDLVHKILNNAKINDRLAWAEENIESDKLLRYLEVLGRPIDSVLLTEKEKLNQLINLGIEEYNKLALHVANIEKYPIGNMQGEFPLVENKDILILEDIFALLENSGVGVPAYYKDIEFEVDGEKATYNRSRSGCYFCFFQQKIEWVWLLEQHPKLFAEAMEYERGDFSWSQEESLEQLSQPERVLEIKREYIKRQKRLQNQKKFKSSKLMDILMDNPEEEIGCASCFI